jgi:hypothetical protein
MILTIEFGQSCLDNGVMSATSAVPGGKDGGLNQITATKRNGPVSDPCEPAGLP